MFFHFVMELVMNTACAAGLRTVRSTGVVQSITAPHGAFVQVSTVGFLLAI